ncbi:MAG: DUF4838 domain-containing protein [Mediterranea sp.]|jgi:hypothetical protein|nr:DUF4838 domain-containing protein [Mediterranea sp.]
MVCCVTFLISLACSCGTRATNQSAEITDIYAGDCLSDSGFCYRNIYSPTGLDAATSAELGLNNFDADWGIWGHNLKKTVDAENNEAFNATVHGHKNSAQLCFSSQELYQRTVDYIVENFGEYQSIRIVIAPTDCPDACTCNNCTRLGNTANSSTPAVTHFVEQLSKRFPVHKFFILSYLSTEQPPTHPLPQNVGVIISAMSLPFCLTDKEPNPHNRFVKQLTQWRRVIKHLYVWDYINNFDDYLTPFPILKVARLRLQYYKKQQVDGIFLNGSGYLYATFGDLKTAVLAGLLRNPNRSVEALAKEFLKKAYPVSYKWIYNYYMLLEDQFPHNKPFHLYMGSNQLKQLYFSASKFYDFYNGLNTFIEQSEGQERTNLQQLRTALSFPLLEMARMYNMCPKAWIEGVKKDLYDAASVGTIQYYNEAEQTIHDYLTEWEQYMMPPSDISNNLLSGIMPKVMIHNDEDDIPACAELLTLTDAVHGFPGNYHCGWVVFPAKSVDLNFSVNDITGSGTLKFSFLQMPRHHIFPPVELEIYKNDVLYRTLPLVSYDKEVISSDGKSHMIKKSVPFSMDGVTRLTIRLIGSMKEREQMAVDEIAFVK